MTTPTWQVAHDAVKQGYGSAVYTRCSDCRRMAGDPRIPIGKWDEHVEGFHRVYGRRSPVGPVDLDRAALRANPRKVFAHYWPAGPRSLDNRTPPEHYWRLGYLAFDGEGGIHARHGGLVRNVPEERPTLPGDWRLADAAWEVGHAARVGIDGFFANIMVVPPTTNWQPQVIDALYRAAAQDPGFLMVPQLDVAGAIAGHDKARIADYLAPFLRHPNTWRVNGRPVLSAFYAEKVPAAWWAELFAALRARGAEPWFMPQYLNADAGRVAHAALPQLAGWGDWGDGDAATNDPAATGARRRRVREALTLGKTWMQPWRVQDARPRAGTYQEAWNLENLRRTVRISVEGGAQVAVIATWNDLTECSGVLPSLYGGTVLLDVLAPMIAWFKAGTFPPVRRDWVYLTHRRQPAAARPLDARQTLLMAPKVGATPGRDKAEAMVALTAPARVEVWSGTRHAAVDDVQPGAFRAVLADLGVGATRARISRGGLTVVECASPHAASVALDWQDLQYVAAQNGAA